MPQVNIPDVGIINFPDDMSPEDITKAIETDILKTAKPQESSVLGDIGKSIVGGVGAAVDFLAPANLAVPGLIEGARTLAPEVLGGVSVEEAAKNMQQGNIPGTEFPYSELQPTKLLERFTGKGSIQNKQYEQANRPLHALTEFADVVGTEATEWSGSPFLGTAANMATAIGTLGLLNKGAVKASNAVANRFPKGADPILERGKELQAEQEAITKPSGMLPGEELLSVGDKAYTDKTLAAVDKTMQKTQRGTVAPQYDLQRAGVIDEFAPDSNYVNPKLNEQVAKDLTNADNLARMQDPLTKDLPIEDRLRSNLELVPKETEVPLLGQEGVPSRARDVIADKQSEMLAADNAAAREAAVKQTQIDAAHDLREQQRGVTPPLRRPDVDSTIPSQSSGSLEPSGTRRINRGTFGQSGALDSSVFRDALTKFAALYKLNPSSKEAHFAFLGDLQRGKPEQAMLNIQERTSKIKGGNAYGHVAEHVGDLTWRLSELFRYGDSPKNIQIQEVLNKINKTLPYIDEATMSVAKHAGIEEYAKKYARAHSELPVYNEVQWLARQSAVAVGHGNLTLAKSYLSQLKARIESNPEKTRLEAYEFNPNYEKVGAGNTVFGRSQRGSIGFKPPSFAEFSAKYSKAGFSPEVLARLYEETYSAKPTVKERVASSPTLSKQASQADKTKFVNAKYFGDVIPDAEFIPAVKGIPDIDVGITKQKFVSSGRMQKELLDHPVTTQIYNIATKHVEEAGLASRRFLDDPRTGIFPIIHRLTGSSLNGFKEAKEYFLDWKPKNEGQATELPPYFSARIKEIHELEAKESAKLWKELEALRPENVTKAKEILNHMIHLWHGPYRFYLTTKTSSGKSKIVTYIAETSKADAEKAAAYFSRTHPEYEQTAIEFAPQMQRQRSSMFDHLLDLSKEGDPKVTEALKNIIKTKEASMERYAGTHQRFEHRAGMGGFLGQKPWLSERQNYKDTLDALREKYDAGYSWIALQKVKQEIRPLQDAIASGEVQTPKALVLGNKYVDHAFGRTVEQSNVIKGLDFAEGHMKGFGPLRRSVKQVNQVLDKVTIPFLLAGKASNIIQNMVQPIVSIPRMIMLANETGGKVSTIPASFAHGAVDGLFNFMDSITLGKSAELSDRIFKKSELTQKIRTAINDMDISRMSMADDRPFFGEGGMPTTIGNAAVDIGLNGLLTILEGPTRSWAFSTYVRKFVKDGHSPDRAIKMAAEQMDSMTNYNKEAAAQIFSDMGMAGMEAKGLHTFMVNYYTQLGQYVGKAVDGFKNSSPKEAVPLAMYMAQTFAFAGALGFIGVDFAEALVELVQTGVRGTNADSKELQGFSLRKWMLENFSDNVSAGPVAGATGLGTYGFFTSKVVDPDRTLLENLFPKTTAKLQIAGGVAQLPKVFSENTPDVEKGNILEKATPRVFTPTIRRKFSEDGNVVLNRSQFKQGMPMYERTPTEATIARHSLGLKATSEALNLEESIQATKSEKRVQDATNEQLRKLDTAFIQLRNKKDPFSEAKVGKMVNSLINDWGVSGDELQTRLETLAGEHAINDAVVRRIVQTKTIPTKSALDKFKRTVDLQERQAKRQGK